MKRLVPLLALAFATSASYAQSLQQYFVLRKQSSVTAPATGAALNELVGSKTFEIQAIVKGSFKVGERSALMVEGPSCGSVIVDANVVPDWLLGNETPARLLVKATRLEENASLRAVLIAAAPENDVAKMEFEEAKKRAAATVAANRRAKVKAEASRSSSGMFGPIGRNTRGARVAPPAKGPSKEWVLPASEVTPVYAKFIKQQNPRLPDAEAMRIAQGIVGFSLHYGVDARLVIAMVMAESSFNPGAVSRSGAMGLGQLMPGTAKWMGVDNPYDSVDNLSGAVKLLRKHITDYKAQTGRDFDALVLALAAYNAGAGAVKRHGGVPPYRETQNYVRKVISIYYKLCGVA